MINADVNYTLAAAELSAVQQLLAIQVAIGAAAPVVTPPTMAKVMQGLTSLSAAYANLQNAEFRDQARAALTQTQAAGA